MSAAHSRRGIGVASLVLVGALFGFSGVIAKHLSGFLDPYQVVEYRFAIALAGALILLALSRERLSFSAVPNRILALYAITFPLSVVLFTLSIFQGTVAIAVFSFYTATLASSFVLGRIFFSEQISARKAVALILMLLAVICLTDPLNHFEVGAGLLLGIASGVVQGIASSFQKTVSGATSRIGLLVIQCLAGTAVAAMVIIARGSSLTPSLGAINWIIVIAFGLSMLAIAYLFLVGFKYVNLNTGSILVSSELLFGPLLAFVLLGEGLTTIVLLGGALTATAGVVVSLDPEG